MALTWCLNSSTWENWKNRRGPATDKQLKYITSLNRKLKWNIPHIPSETIAMAIINDMRDVLEGSGTCSMGYLRNSD